MMIKGYYRTKPVSVEAFRWEFDSDRYFLAEQFDLPPNHIVVVGDRLQVVTGEGTAMASFGDWVVLWKQTSKKLQVFSDSDFQRTFQEDARAKRIRGWRESER